MATIDELIIRVRADIRNASRNLKRVESMMGRFKARVSSALTSLREHWMAYAAAIAATVGPLATAVKWAAEEEAVSVRTAALLRQQGVAWEEVSGALDAYFKKIERLTSYNDTEVQEAFNQLIVTGVDYQTALENLTMVTRVAYSTNIDLRTAAMYVGRAIEGDSNMLARYIPSIRKLNTEQRTWANVQKILNESMADSTARGRSLEGATANLWNQIHNLAEAIGTELIPAIKDLSNWMAAVNWRKASIQVISFLRIMWNGAKIVRLSFEVLWRSIQVAGYRITAAISKVIGVVKAGFKVMMGDFEGASEAWEEWSEKSEEYSQKAEDAYNKLYDVSRRYAETAKDTRLRIMRIQQAEKIAAMSAEEYKEKIDDVTDSLNRQTNAARGVLKTIQELSRQRFGFEMKDLSEVKRFIEKRKEWGKVGETEKGKPIMGYRMPEITSPIPQPSITSLETMPPTIKPATAVKPADRGNVCECVTQAINKLNNDMNINITIDRIVSEEDFTEICKKVAAATASGAGCTNWGVR